MDGKERQKKNVALYTRASTRERLGWSNSRPHVHMSRIVATRGGLLAAGMHVRYMYIHAFTCKPIMAHLRIGATMVAVTLVLVTVGSSQYVLGYLTSSQMTGWSLFSPPPPPGIGIGKGRIRQSRYPSPVPVANCSPTAFRERMSCEAFVTAPLRSFHGSRR